MTDASTATFKTRLTRRLADLRARLDRIDDEITGHIETDFEERATEREQDEVLEGIGQSGQLEIRQIEAALDRIAAGDFGLCVQCGAPIAPERLEILPHAALCAPCAARAAA